MDKSNLFREKQLFQLIAGGDEAAFNEFYLTLVTDCSAYVYRLVRSQEGVKEILQESLIRLWLHRDKLTDVEYPRAWLFRIISNECSRYLGKHGFENNLRASLDQNDFAAAIPAVNQTEIDVSYRETKRIIAEAVSSLPPQRRQIYQLSREAGLTLPEIAERLNVSRDYVKKALMAALQFIRQKLMEAGRAIPLLILMLF